MGLGDLGKSVTLAHGELCGGAEGASRCGKVKLSADGDVVGIENAGIDSNEIVPKEPLAQMMFSNTPQRVAGLDGDDI